MMQPVLVLVLVSCGVAAGSWSTLSCDNRTSCSPAACVKNTDATCVMNAQKVDFQKEITDMGCKPCTQSTAARCRNLATTLKVQSGNIKAAYCNADYLVVWSNGLAEWDVDAYLSDVPLPPGGDAGCRVRTGAELLTVYKIPLNPTLRQTGGNTIPNPLPNVPGMPAAGAVGMATNGVPMFPNYNNRGQYAWVSCEVDICNAHSGRGEDYHFHGDPFGEKCLYSLADYAGRTHPPLIGYGLDGYEIYGRYTAEGQDGQSVGLDECGGHVHGDLGYHYHSEVEEGLSADKLDGVSGGPYPYTAYKLAPTTCWRGNVDMIPNFWAGGQVAYDRSKGTFSAAADYNDLKPCCAMSEFYTAPGIAFSSTSSPSPSTTSPSPSTTSPSPSTPSPSPSSPSPSTASPSPSPTSSSPSTPSPSAASPSPSPTSPSPSTPSPSPSTTSPQPSSPSAASTVAMSAVVGLVLSLL